MRRFASCLVLCGMMLSATASAADPNEEHVLSLARQGNELIAQGDYTAAQAKFEEAITAAKWDPGKTYTVRIANEESIDPEKLAHGKEQLKRIVADRPHMDAHGILDSEIARWCERRLAGIETGIPVTWDSWSPGDILAGHSANHDDNEVKLYISAADDYRKVHAESVFEATWASLIYELINASHTYQFDVLDKAAANGDISREYYVMQKAAIEVVTNRKHRAFYVRAFLPWAKEAELTSYPFWWRTSPSDWSTPEKSLLVYQDRAGYPWDPYGDHYDRHRGLVLIDATRVEAAKPVEQQTAAKTESPQADIKKPDYKSIDRKRYIENCKGYSGF